MTRSRNTRLWVVVIAVVALVVALLPALVAYRYTSPAQRDEFVTHPWRGWSFIVTALGVPGDSELKTSGEALRKAEWLYRQTGIEPREVQLLFVAAGEPYAFEQTIDGNHTEAAVTPEYRFIWEVRGTVPTGAGPAAASETAVVALLDYQTGRLLYDVRDDLPVTWLSPSPAPMPQSSPASP